MEYWQGTVVKVIAPEGQLKPGTQLDDASDSLSIVRTENQPTHRLTYNPSKGEPKGSPLLLLIKEDRT